MLYSTYKMVGVFVMPESEECIMKPVKTENTNSILKAPNGVENVDDLPVTRFKFEDGSHAVESCWGVSEEELEIIKKTGKVYFVCIGDTHPPILLSSKSQLEF